MWPRGPAGRVSTRAATVLALLAAVAVAPSPARATSALEEITANFTSQLYKAASDAQEAVDSAVLFLTGGEAQATQSLEPHGPAVAKSAVAAGQLACANATGSDDVARVEIQPGLWLTARRLGPNYVSLAFWGTSLTDEALSAAHSPIEYLETAVPNALAPQAAVEAVANLIETRVDATTGEPTTRFASAMADVLDARGETPLIILVTAQGPETALAALAAPYLGMAYPSATVQAVLFDARYRGQFNPPFSWAFERLVDLSYMFNFTLESVFGVGEGQLECTTPDAIALQAAHVINATASDDDLLDAAGVPGLYEAEVWGLSSDDDDDDDDDDDEGGTVGSPSPNANETASEAVPLVEAFSGPSTDVTGSAAASPAIAQSARSSPSPSPDVVAYVSAVVTNLVSIVDNSIKQLQATNDKQAPPPPPVSFTGLLTTLTGGETAATTSSIETAVRDEETQLVQAFDGPTEPAVEGAASSPAAEAAAISATLQVASPAAASPGASAPSPEAPAAETKGSQAAAALIARLLPPTSETASEAATELEKILSNPLYLPADLGVVWSDEGAETNASRLTASSTTLPASTPLQLVLPSYLTPAYSSASSPSPSADGSATNDGLARLSTEASIDELLNNSPWWTQLFEDRDGSSGDDGSGDDGSASVASASLEAWISPVLAVGKRRLFEDAAPVSSPPSAPALPPPPPPTSPASSPSSSSSSSAPCSPILCRARPMLEAACVLFSSSFSGLFPDIPHALLQSSGTGAAAAVGYDASTETAFVLWKGSQSVADFVQDALAFLSPLDASWFPHVPGIAKAHVHRGFLNQFKSLTVAAPSDSPSANLTAAILSCSNGTLPTRILVAGHSLGSALAEISSVWLSGVFPSAAVAAYGTGTPLVGDAHWLKAVRASVGGVRRFAYNLDLVPALPWFDGYAKPGNAFWIRPADELASPVSVASPLYAAERSPEGPSPPAVAAASVEPGSPALEADSDDVYAPSLEAASEDVSSVADPATASTIAESRPQLPYGSLSVADHFCSNTYVPSLRAALALDVPQHIAMMPQEMWP